MTTYETLIAILLSLGAVQGVVYGVILWRNRGPNRLALRFLATVLFFLSYQLACETLLLFGIGHYDTWYHLMIDLNWVHGGLIYLSVKSFVNPKFRLSRKDLWHFLPVALQFAWSNYVRSQNFFWDGTRESLTWLGYWGYDFWMNYPTIYIVASGLVAVYAFKAFQLLKQPPPGGELIPEKVAWIRKVILVFGAYFLIFLSILVIDLLAFDPTFSEWYFYFNRFYYYPFLVGVAILTYWLAVVGFQRKDEKVLKSKPQLSAKEQQEIKQLANKLHRLMEEEKRYREPTLNLTNLAAALQVKPYQLTKCLKHEVGVKFTDYINKLRIAELESLLQKEGSEKYTLLALALEAGFNSKASFNRAIQKHQGISPSQWRDQLGAKSKQNL